MEVQKQSRGGIHGADGKREGNRVVARAGNIRDIKGYKGI